MIVGRFFDTVLAAFVLVLLSPLLLPVALLIKLHDGGAVFHVSSRVGMNGKPFRLYKFRTMVAQASEIGKGITSANDRRITPVGRWLRKYKIDEIPQLYNVIRSDMALVGPRPEDPRYVALYTPAQRAILSSRPGITSPASLAFRHEEKMLSGDDWEDRYINEILPTKLAIELEYASRRTLATDIGVLFKTIAAVPAQPHGDAEGQRI